MAAPKTYRGTILIIDDEANLRSTLTRVLQSTGCAVTGAVDGPEALRFLSENNFDLVFLDLHLPGMHGLDVLREIRKQSLKLPVILLTAHGSMNSALEAMHLGATDYLLKPVNPKELLSRTQAILQDQTNERRRLEIQTQISALQEELKQLEAGRPTAASNALVPAFSQASDERFLKRGILVLDLQARRGVLKNNHFDLPPASFDYLVSLARHSPAVISYQDLVLEAQGYQAVPAAARELAKWHVHVIRQALEANPDQPQRLLNVRGTGYRLLIDS